VHIGWGEAPDTLKHIRHQPGIVLSKSERASTDGGLVRADDDCNPSYARRDSVARPTYEKEDQHQDRQGWASQNGQGHGFTCLANVSRTTQTSLDRVSVPTTVDSEFSSSGRVLRTTAMRS
jgi:hypothetical protein